MGETATRLVLATFRTNGALLDAGDRLTADQGLTSALWQVLGAAVLAERPLTVAQIARRMGLSRQSVHGSVRRLAERGAVRARAQRESPTLAARSAHRALRGRLHCGGPQAARWVNRLVAGLPNADLETAERVLEALCERRTRKKRPTAPNRRTRPPDRRIRPASTRCAAPTGGTRGHHRTNTAIQGLQPGQHDLAARRGTLREGSERRRASAGQEASLNDRTAPALAGPAIIGVTRPPGQPTRVISLPCRVIER